MICTDAFRSFIHNTSENNRRYATLGPKGTSSRFAAEHLAKRFPAEVVFFDSYEDAAAAVLEHPDETALVVANAYSRINRFYISHDLHPSGAFFCNTPAYLIAAKSRSILQKTGIRIGSHPAPSHLIAAVLDHPAIEITESLSTHAAALETAQGKTDACLTTESAAKLCGLETIAVALPTIPMLWTIFIKKEYEDFKKWKQKPSLCYAATYRQASRPTLPPSWG